VIGLTLRNHDGLLDATKRPLAVMNPWGGARQYCEGNADQNCLEKSAARTFACRGLAAAPIGVDLLHVGVTATKETSHALHLREGAHHVSTAPRTRRRRQMAASSSTTGRSPCTRPLKLYDGSAA
jgi:hypothetical protein